MPPALSHPPEKLNEARLMLARRLSDRRIAAELGLPRSLVKQLREGTYRPPEAKQRKQQNPLGGFTPVRCPGCGGMVKWPCLLCAVRQRNWKELEASDA